MPDGLIENNHIVENIFIIVIEKGENLSKRPFSARFSPSAYRQML
jgi:hypothetical protein